MIFYIYIYRTKLYFRWQFILNGLSHVIEFWDSKMSGKKKIAVDSKVIYFKQFDGDITFGLTFTIGYNTFNLKQYSENVYHMFVDGYSFKELQNQEQIEKKMLIQKKERDKLKKKKMEDEYYRRALKYNGNDYYEGKEKTLLNNNTNNNNIQYNYEYYKKHRGDYINNYNNYNYYGNNINNNNYNNQDNILNQEDIDQINQNLNNNQNNNYNINNNINNNYQNNNQYNQNYQEEPKNNYNEDKDNLYPSFSQIQNKENNTGYNNHLNLNDYGNDNNNYNNHNNNNNNNNLMNQIEDVFSSDQYQNQNQNKQINKTTKIDLPSYSEIYQKNNSNSEIKNKTIKKSNKDNDNKLFDYIGNLNNNGNKDGQKLIESIPIENDKGGYHFGFENDESQFKVDENNQIQMDIYNHDKVDKEKKKIFLNKSSFKIPLKKEDYDMDNPYNDD